MLKVAVLYTGQTRTINKTLPYFKNNVLLNENVHVFACIHNDTDEDIKQIIEAHIGHHLKSVTDGAPSSCFNFIQDRLLATMKHRIDFFCHDYLKTGGSMIEYFQLYLAYLEMVAYEREHQITYDYIIRMRTDLVISQRIDFHWLNLSDQELDQRYEQISQLKHTTDTKTIQMLMMNTLINWNRIHHIETNQPYSHNCYDIPHLNSDYIKNGRYIITLRRNVFYLIKRQYFNMIPSIAFLYGTIFTDVMHWFNAENQFENVLVELGINIFDSSTPAENNSLNYYYHENYLDENGHLKNEDSYNFFIMRY